MIWLIRTQGLRANITSIVSATIITTLGLVLPFTIPGYQQSILGFNLSNAGNGATFSIIINHVNAVLPQIFQIDPSQYSYNLIWITATTALYTTILGIVWTRAKSLSSIDVMLLGLLAWLIPLRIVYTHYLVWAIIPFLTRGRLKQTIIVAGLLQFADNASGRSDSSSLCPKLPEEELAGSLYTISLDKPNSSRYDPSLARQGRPVARYVKPASSDSFRVLRFLVSKRMGSGFICAFTSERSTSRNAAWFVAITTTSTPFTESRIDPADKY
jgi:hypothetical protein